MRSPSLQKTRTAYVFSVCESVATQQAAPLSARKLEIHSLFSQKNVFLCFALKHFFAMVAQLLRRCFTLRHIPSSTVLHRIHAPVHTFLWSLFVLLLPQLYFKTVSPLARVFPRFGRRVCSEFANSEGAVCASD